MALLSLDQDERSIRAPQAAIVTELMIAAGQVVRPGDQLLTLEAHEVDEECADTEIGYEATLATLSGGIVI